MLMKMANSKHLGLCSPKDPTFCVLKQRHAQSILLTAASREEDSAGRGVDREGRREKESCFSFLLIQFGNGGDGRTSCFVVESCCDTLVVGGIFAWFLYLFYLYLLSMSVPISIYL